MLSLNLHVRQVLGEWQVSAVLVRDLGKGFQPEKSVGVSHLPLTSMEWETDDLTAVLSAVARWSGMTMDGSFSPGLD
jgi:hypothetical protein